VRHDHSRHAPAETTQSAGALDFRTSSGLSGRMFGGGGGSRCSSARGSRGRRCFPTTVLLAGEGRPAGQIAERVGCSLPTVKTWRSRYQRDGLDGLRDRPLTHGSEVRAKLIALACTAPPDTDEGVRRERFLARRARRAGRHVRVAGARDPAWRRHPPAPDRAVDDERAGPRLRRPGGGCLRPLSRSAAERDRRLDRREDLDRGARASPAGHAGGHRPPGAA